MTLARTDAAGGGALDSRVLAFSTSLEFDRALLREDIVQNLAHTKMLAEIGILSSEEHVALRDGLAALFREGDAGLPDEEDVHMAIERWLLARVGDAAKRMHSARSRNDQVATCLRLHVRENARTSLVQISLLLRQLLELAKASDGIFLPAYTHRQRAQPIALAFFYLAHATALSRDIDGFRFVLDSVAKSPLGACAVSGTSLPIDRNRTASLLRFSEPTNNALDTVGDRDFALDYLYAATRFFEHASRISTDFIDYSTAEFGFIELGTEIACGSSMMPQKRNPDLFELIRGKSGGAIGRLVSLLVTMKGLPSGYNRDQQEDREPILGTTKALASVFEALPIGLRNARFRKDRCLAAIDSDYTQATDIAEALVKEGVPFRDAYKLTGELVAKAQAARAPLKDATAIAEALDPRFTKRVLEALDPRSAAARKASIGGTGDAALPAQFAAIERAADEAEALARKVPALDDLFTTLVAL